MATDPDVLFSELLALAKKTNPVLDEVMVKKAYALARKAHGDVIRRTGLLYIHHPLGVAKILVEKNYARSEILSAALLHDVIEDTTFTRDDIAKQTSEEIAELVEGLTKIRKQRDVMEIYDARNLRKILLATAKDVRVMIIKIADRIDNLSSLGIFRREKQLRIAKNTLEVFSPITQKLGLYDFKAELEDSAFEFLDPDFYEFLKKKINANRAQRKKNKDLLLNKIEVKLKEERIPLLSISGRAKHLYSIYKKIRNENKLLEQIYDLYGFRIVCKSQSECYDVYRLLQQSYKELPDRFKDYIQTPKENGYQSLHTNFLIDDKIAEIQIRTQEMDYQAEGGVATHWKYKQTERDKKFDKKLNWLRQLLKWRDTQNSRISVEIFKGEIITVTPKGDPVVLKEGSTPVDFAFTIHSGVGRVMRAAKVNGSIVPLSHKLKSGDIVEIETSKTKTVNANWIGLSKQTSTIAKIRKELGLAVDISSAKENRKRNSATQTKKQEFDDYYQTLEQFSHLTKRKVRIARCCSPKSIDPIVAFRTKTKKEIVVHKFDCAHQHALDARSRIIPEPPKKRTKKYDSVHIVVTDTPGIVIEILNYFLHHNFDIIRASSREGKNNMVLILEVSQKDGRDIKTELADLQKLDAVSGIKVL